MPNKIDKALSHFQSGNRSKSLEIIEDILSTDPNQAFAWFLSAVIHTQQSNTDSAIKGFKNAIKHQPIYPEAFNNLGVTLESINRKEEAKSAYKKAIEQKKGYASAYYNLANIQKIDFDYSNAIVNYSLAIKYKPDYVNAINNLALIYQHHLNYKKSNTLLTQALKFSGNDPEIQNNFGYNKYCLFKYEDALKIYQRILRGTPNYPPTLLNCGLLMRAMGKLDEARQYFTAISDDPEFGLKALNNLSHLELSVNNLKSGWNYYRSRPSTRDCEFDKIEHLPKNLDEKKILLFKDQGIGDEIFFARFIPLLEKYNAKLSYYTDEKLAVFWKRRFENINILTTKPIIAEFDTVISIGELPRLLLLDENRSNTPPITLSPLTTTIENIKNQLPNNNKKNIAITWEAGVMGGNSLFKRFPPELLGKKMASTDSNIIIIQRNPKPSDIKLLEKSLGRKAFNLSYFNENLEEMLALLSLVDDYYCVSNTNTHLMSALSRPCRVFVPYPAEWRWFSEGPTSAWFPHNTIYRQTNTGTWPESDSG